MSQVTGKKVAVTPMPTPTGTSGNIIDSFNTQDDQTVNAPSIHIVKDALTTINDNLSGFKFYPIGTQLVALVSNNSYYTDANGNYIIADSTTGQSMIDNVTYKALASVEDLRGKVGADTATPFKSEIMPKSGGYRKDYSCGNISLLKDQIIVICTFSTNTPLSSISVRGDVTKIADYSIEHNNARYGDNSDYNCIGSQVIRVYKANSNTTFTITGRSGASSSTHTWVVLGS